jgi:glyoxalase family protein
VLSGIHHLTAFAGDAERNLDFYTQFLGMRLIKRTVNFDDPATYHFYFGDERGTPGTLLTFFPWPTAPAGSSGSGQIAAVSLSVPENSLDEWVRRARERKIGCSDISTRFGIPWVALCDPAGFTVELSGAGSGEMRLHSATLREFDIQRTADFLTDVLGFSAAGAEGDRTRWRLNDSLIDIIRAASADRAKLSAGMAHHVAFRVADEEAQNAWRAKLVDAGVRVTRVIDRRYFKSIYFREPGGVLFEIATDGPGFFVDEDVSGRELKLPPWLEPMRESIERRLPRVKF